MPPGPACVRGLKCERSGQGSGPGETVSRGSGTHAGPGGPGLSPWCPGGPHSLRWMLGAQLTCAFSTSPQVNERVLNRLHQVQRITRRLQQERR